MKQELTIQNQQNKTLYSGVFSSFSECLEDAVSKNVDLDGLYIYNQDLSHITLDGLMARNIHFDHCNLSGANLSECYIENSCFESCLMDDVCLCYTRFSHVDFKNTQFLHCDLYGSRLEHCHFNDPSILHQSLKDCRSLSDNMFTDTKSQTHDKLCTPPIRITGMRDDIIILPEMVIVGSQAVKPPT